MTERMDLLETLIKRYESCCKSPKKRRWTALRDEEHEAVARTRLVVDDFFRNLRNEATGSTNEEDDLRKEAAQFRDGLTRKITRSKLSTSDNWVLGSVLRSGDLRSYEDLHAAKDPAYRNFDSHLRTFLRDSFPHEHLRYENDIRIEIFQCLYIAYQSRDDWREGEDILRYNPSWYNHGPCYNFLPSGRIVDVAMVRVMASSNWQPKMGRLVFDQSMEFSFLLVEHIIRGELLAPVRPPPSGRPNLHYLVDVVNGDMFLR
ncbi:hypothetical protein C8F01DRAFT_1253570 [Mycena amicta]|nr:hypothetical protein C8F01DRAFT_1253570 [Mycena amicta]